VAAADNAFIGIANLALHIDGSVQADANNCTDCHAADIDGVANGAHAAHTDTVAFLTGKQVDAGGYGGTGWYTTTWVNGKPNFGCGECHPAAEGTSHPINGLNVDIDPTGETPTAGSLKLKNTNSPVANVSLRTSVTCDNIYCHSSGESTPAYATSPNWYNDTVSGNCTDCHGNSPATNAHSLHAVGIHYTTLHDDDGTGLMPSAAAPGTDAGAAHGNTATADTIGCQTCHNNTVAVEYNAGNSVCGTCHSDTDAPATGNEKAIISTAGSTHLNGQPDVVFSSLTGFKSKAQLRDDITTVYVVNNSWQRSAAGYKNVIGNSFDSTKSMAANYVVNGSDGSCSNIACHNSITTPTWKSGSSGDCMACHTQLPQ